MQFPPSHRCPFFARLSARRNLRDNPALCKGGKLWSDGADRRPGEDRQMRSFVAIPLPETITDALATVSSALPFGRIVAPENLHLTLLFLGEQSEAMLEEAHFALETLRHPAFDLTLRGLDIFGGAAPQSLHIAVKPEPALIDLQKRVRSRLHAVGLHGDSHRFSPHVTLARFARSLTPDETGKIGRFLAARADLRLPAFRVSSFCLFESILTSDGPHYEVLAEYPLPASG